MVEEMVLRPTRPRGTAGVFFGSYLVEDQGVEPQVDDSGSARGHPFDHEDPMWAYEGPNDPTRMSPVELSANELATHVRMITCTKSSDPCNIDCTITPYGPERPFEEVSFSCVLLLCALACFDLLLDFLYFRI